MLEAFQLHVNGPWTRIEQQNDTGYSWDLVAREYRKAGAVAARSFLD